jgi:hypothetical protein
MDGGVLIAQESRPGRSGGAMLKYMAALFLFASVLTIGAIVNESEYIDRIPSQILIFLICSAPVFLTGNHPRHRLLVIFMACYYLIFGISDFVDIFLGIKSNFIMGDTSFLRSPDGVDRGMTKPDWVVIIGAISFLCGYYLLSKFIGNRQSRAFSRDWNHS